MATVAAAAEAAATDTAQVQVEEPILVWEATGKTDDELALEFFDFQTRLTKEEIARRSVGQHFTFMESVWGCGDVEIKTSDFDAIKRKKEQGLLLKTCYENLSSGIRNPDHSSGTANHSKNVLKLDCFGNMDAEAAHLLSHAEVCHKAFGFLGEAAVGVDVDSFETGGNSKLKRRKILVGVKAGKHFTSLKGHKFNKVYCSSQKMYFDSEDPSMLLVPCLPFDKVMDWASNKDTPIDYDCLVLTFGEKKRRAAQNVLQMVPGECSKEEIDDARELLTRFIKGVAGSLKDNDVLESFTKKELLNKKNISLLRWSKLVEEIKTNKRFRVGVPTEINWDVPVHVGKVRMTLGNSLPDPWLLLVKSAINYSAFRKAKLMPACPPSEDDDDSEPPNTLQGAEDAACDKGAESPAERGSFFEDSLRRVGLKSW